MRRLRRPLLLLFPLGVLAVGLVWSGFAPKGTVPRAKTAAAKWERGAAVAIASSDIGVRVDLATGRVEIYAPVWEGSGEEKLAPPKVEKGEGAVVSVARSAREMTLTNADGSRSLFTLAADGRSIRERWSPAPPPLDTVVEDGFRTYAATVPAFGKAIPRPEVSIRIESDDPRDGAVAAACLDDLVTAVHPRLRQSISPFGLTNSLYFGHVFWDADVWVFSALALLDPEAAAEIPQYRLRQETAARRSFFRWDQGGRANAFGKTTTGGGDPPEAGIKYPWESSVSGGETVPGPSRFEDHITGSVAWSLRRAADLGLVPSADAERIVRGAGTFYNLRRSGRDLRATVSPDEFHTGDNDLYTNLLAGWAIRGGRFSEPFPLKLPRDARGFLTYDGDAGRGYKQAAALLAVYPLQYPPAEREAAAMLDRYAEAVTQNGPAMSDAIHAIVAARAGLADRGLKYWRRSWAGYWDPATGMFSEKRAVRRELFYTGEAGVTQAVLYGFLGLRVDREGAGKGTLVAKLRNGMALTCAPHLPKGWRSVTLDGLSVLGKRYRVVASAGDRVSITAL